MAKDETSDLLSHLPQKFGWAKELLLNAYEVEDIRQTEILTTLLLEL
jgi:hypothetical protein